jgi:hypothetical protein
MARTPELDVIKGYYQIDDCLSEDVLSVHYCATHKVTGHSYFVYGYKKKFLSPDLVQRLIKVAQILRDVRHPSLLPLDDFHYDGDRFFLIYGLKKPLTSLADYLETHPTVSESILGKWCIQILSALMLLESKSLCGGCVTLEDIYIDSDHQIFLSKVVFQATILTEVFDRLVAVDEGIFSPPELVARQEYTIRSDMYSFGVLLHILFGKTWPYPSVTKISAIKEMIIEGPDPFYKRAVTTPDFVEPVIEVCLQCDPESRYRSIGELLKALQDPTMGAYSPPPRPGENRLRRELEYELKQKKQQEKRVMGYVSGIFILGIAAVFLVYNVFVKYSTSIPDTVVPAIYGLPLDEAHKKLQEMDLLGEIAGERNSPLPKGVVVESKPPQGREVKQSRIIRLFISKGPANTSFDSGHVSSTANVVSGDVKAEPYTDSL